MNNGVKPAVSYRGIGIYQMRLGNYDDAITAFTSALSEEKVSKSMAQDLYLYRAMARLQAGYLDDAMADYQTLAQKYEMDADAWFLTGKVPWKWMGMMGCTLILSRHMGEDSSYDRAIQIYETYLEGHGSRWNQVSGAVLSYRGKGSRGSLQPWKNLLLYGGLYQCPKQADRMHPVRSTEALLVLGMVYGAQGLRKCPGNVPAVHQSEAG